MDDKQTTFVASSGSNITRKRALLLFLLLAGCGVGYWIGSGAPSSLLINGGLTVDEAFLDFGNVWESPRFSWKFPIHNEHKEEIEVVGFSTTCSCVGIQPGYFKLAPGTTHEVQVNLDLHKARRGKTTDWNWRFQAGIFPQIAGQPLPQKGWIVRGYIRRLLRASPETIFFGNEMVHGQPFIVGKTKIFAGMPLNELRGECDKGKASLIIQRLGPADFELTVAPNASLPVGTFSIDIILQPGQGDKERFPPSTLTAKGIVHQEVEPLPDTLILGAVPIGEKVSRTVRLISRTGETFQFRNWWVEGSAEGVNVHVEDTANAFAVDVQVNGPPETNQTRMVILEVLYGKRRKPMQIRLPVSYFTLLRRS